MKTKSFISRILSLLISLAFIVFFSELLTRFFWGGPITQSDQKWEKFDMDLDSICGYRCKAGNNKFVVISDTVEANCTECGRKTSDVFFCNDSDKHINFYGCSFTFGHGLLDSSTFAWRLQKKLPNYTINNFGFEGYGVSQVYAQITEHLKKSPRPRLIIVNYAAFHDRRNMILNAPRRDAYFYQKDKSILSKINFPVLYLKKDKLVLDYRRYSYKQRIPFTDKLALMNLLDATLVNLKDKSLQPEKITIEAFVDLSNKCKLQNTLFVVNGIVDDSKTMETLKKLNVRGVLTSNVHVDLDNKLLLLKDGFHPGQKANEILADGFFSVIQNQLYNSTK